MPGRKIKEQQRARKLRAQGKSLNQIVKQLEVSKSSVSVWVRDVRLTKKQQSELKQRELSGGAKGRKKTLRYWQEYRKKYPRPGPDLELQSNLNNVHDFFYSWSFDMAYVLGFFAADGCMYHSSNGGHSTGGWYTVFTSTDLQLLETTKELMNIRNKIEAEIRSDHRKTKYFIRIVNKNLFLKLGSLGMTPRKSLTLQFPDVPRRYLTAFTRGYFDGDGYVFFARYKRKDYNSVRKIFQTGFTSGSNQFLTTLQNRLQAGANMGLGSLHPNGSNWELSYSTNDSRHLYKFMYPTATVPCLKRKRKIFERAIKSGSVA